ncbi:23S rRNA (cytidine(2498)-2'-O)-methyltransferase RlmM [Alteromonas facilis]|uniref:23S rRNA (cytidine(2498)-2'-O)-methyltransferase RlmM n=1 Tax=Alteromonas facilis TaxID=2048004 RepID=UPI000C293325|nr:23S rRNA (cytidine(2498)-2'-O)-methyltransferase RlmM [Alteromonas facilis]
MTTKYCSLLAYCRAGYENDLAAELTQMTAQLGVYGYPQAKAGDGYVQFILHDDSAHRFVKQCAVSDIIFARQLFVSFCTIEPFPSEHRVEAVLDGIAEADLEGLSTDLSKFMFGQAVVEYPDTESGKQVARFAKKFAVPLRQALRKRGLLSKTARNDMPCLHVFIDDFARCFLGYSLPQQHSPYHNGIHRLKFPNEAPSRSTLKLEEAILDLVTLEQQQMLFREGARAVDLGACPGGWTYQLVKRGMHVEAVDNGAMAESLMKTGQVSYFAADGFKYKPQYGSAQLLVCDMIERPDRVAQLMQSWLIKGYAQAAIFNLKLPMKKRFDTVSGLLSELKTALKGRFIIRCKQLYHNRDEVTLSVMPKE